MSVAFVTMVYNEPVFLDIWVRYYSTFTDRSNLFIIPHGSDQHYLDDVAKGCQVFECPRDPMNPNLDRERFGWISDFCSKLTNEYDRVIFNDVDEIVVLDPLAGADVVKYIEAIPADIQVVTPLGLEVIHQKLLENDYDYGRGLLNQRRHVRVSGLYSKPCISNTEIIWGPDGHGCSHDQLYLDDNLYLFHLKWFDDQFQYERFRERASMRFVNHRGVSVMPGAGTWQWDEQTYRLAVNGFLRARLDPLNEGFDFSRHRAHLRDSFKGGNGRYRLAGFTDRDLRWVPERFVGLV